ncbi:MAG: hypothetical protein KGJ60_15135 [Verrucomicrobiota bacterium]|nr:hypothetical protein [Verrucomicrobiota bacterium]
MSAIAARDGEDRAPEAALKAVIFYDDLVLAGRATALLERAAARADESLRWDAKLWRLDVLQRPELAAVTAAIAADADLIMLAANQADPAPKELLDWLERWAQNRTVADAALLTLCPDESDAPTSLWRALKGFAARRKLSFLDHGGAGVEPLRPLRPMRQREPAVPTALEPIGNPAPVPQHWGINE